MQRCGGTPSVIACGDATFPKGTAFGGGDKVSGVAQRRPLGGAVERSETEGVRIPKVAVAILNRIYTGGISLHAKQPLHGKAQRLLCYCV